MLITLLIFFGSIVALVGLHEAGHFFAAKLSGVLVKEFAVGFGPRLISYQSKETRYSIRAIPFGGYVRMAGEDRRETDETIPADRILYNKPPYVRAAISLAGPLANLIAAFLVGLLVLWGFGLPMLQVADVVPGSPAAELLLPGDRIRSMGGTPIFDRADATSVIEGSGGAPIEIELERDGEPWRLTVTPTYEEDGERYVIGAYFLTNTFTNELTQLTVASPLRLAGVHAGDRIVAIDATPVDTAVDLFTFFEEAEGPVDGVLTVERGGETLELPFSTTQAAATELFEGVTFGDLGVVKRRPGPLAGLRLGAAQFAGSVGLLATWARQLISGQVAAGEAIAGPVGLAQLLGQGARMGAIVFFNLLAFLSINFGLLNLIPFPALDGSRVAFALYEWVRGRPIAPEREGLIHAIGFVILLGVMILVTYQDIVKLFR
jgi:regulator of sigma E protease